MRKSIKITIASTASIKAAKAALPDNELHRQDLGVAVYSSTNGNKIVMVDKEWKIIPLYFLVNVIFPIVYFFTK